MNRTREIDLMAIARSLLRRWWLIVLCVVLFCVGSFFYTQRFVTPMYQASVTIYVFNGQLDPDSSKVSAADLATSQRLVATYVNIIKSNRVLERVAEEAEVKLSAGAIRGMMAASSIEETEMFRVSVSSANPEQAAKIANAVAEVAPSEISYFLPGSSAKVVDEAKVPGAPYSPNVSGNVMKGGLLGGLLAAAVLVLQSLLDVRIKDESDLERISSAPILGLIPSFDSETKKEYTYKSAARSKEKGRR